MTGVIYQDEVDLEIQNQNQNQKGRCSLFRKLR